MTAAAPAKTATQTFKILAADKLDAIPLIDAALEQHDIIFTFHAAPAIDGTAKTY